jgi:hypothetical protein
MMTLVARAVSCCAGITVPERLGGSQIALVLVRRQADSVGGFLRNRKDIMVVTLPGWRLQAANTGRALLLATAVALLVLPAPVRTQASAPVAIITANLGYNGGTTGTINTTGANLLVACVSTHGYGTLDPQSPISDSRSNSWTLAAESLAYQDGEIHLYYSTPTSVGPQHSFTVSGSIIEASINVMAWAGIDEAPLDQAAGAGAVGTSIQPGSITPTQNNALLISCLTNTADSSSSSRTINGGFTIAGQIGESASNYSMSVAGAYLLQTTASAANPTWSYPVNNTANAVIASFKTAQSSGGGDDLAGKPLFYESDMLLVGGFKTPNDDANEWSGRALAYNDNSLFLAVQFFGNSKVMEISIPAAVNSSNTALMNTASTLQTATDVTEGNISSLTSNVNRYRNWGLLVHEARLVGTAFDYYDASYEVVTSHYARSTTLSASSFTGWKALWDTAKTGFVSGPMAIIPSYAQAALGGKAIATGAGNASIIGRLSWGHAAFAFDPADITSTASNPISAQPLMYFDDDHEMIEGAADSLYNPPGDNVPGVDPNPIWHRATAIGGIAIPEGYRTLLYFGLHGGERCYGEGTDNEALAGQLAPSGHYYCYDPQSASQGEHAYPYHYQVWAFDLAQLAEVKQGTRSRWDVQPYAYWTLTFPVPQIADRMPDIGGVAYDPVNKAFYVTQIEADPAAFVRRPIIWKYSHP